LPVIGKNGPGLNLTANRKYLMKKELAPIVAN